MPIDRDLTDLDKCPLDLWHQFANEVRQEQLKLTQGKWRHSSSLEPIEPADIVEWACSVSDDAGDDVE